MSQRPILTILLIAVLLPFPLLSQPPSRPTKKKESGKEAQIKPYDEVITKEARSDPGLFLVHRIGKKIFYEIGGEALGKDMLWVTQIAATQAGFGYGGTPVRNRVVRWVLRDENVLLLDIKYGLRASGRDGVVHAVEATSLPPIIMSFPVKAWGKDRAPVIEVTRLLTGDVKEFSPKERLGASSLDKERTFLDEIHSYPRNIETAVLATYKLKSGGDSRGGRRPGPPRRTRSRRDPSLSAVTVKLRHSMVLLPDEPMRPRIHDARVGFFNVSFQDFSTDDHQVKEIRYITRWRLEKKNPSAPVSEPRKPIVFYVGRGVPDRWRPYVKRGIEMWRPAFEAAGFKNAIVALDPPDPKDDPEWNAEDARYSTIRWLPSGIENAMGPHVHDPRTGEILEADILVYHNVLKLIRDWYFVQASACDERARKLPMPDDLIGEILAYVIAHEVGHSLGFPHNMKASSAFTVEQLRDPEFTRKWGTEASIMDYGRFNYVAQPGDGAALIPKIGPYDFFAVKWGYAEFPGSRGPEDDKRHLRELTALQVENPVLRFGPPNSGQDPTQQTEDLGSDPIAATELGLRNIRRIATFLVDATCRPGEDYELLRNMYEQLLAQRNRELGHVASMVGGVREANLWYGDAESRFEPVPAEKQRAAVAFLLEQGFKTPLELLDPKILRKLEASGAAKRILSGHQRLLRSLLSERRLNRMSELAEFHGKDAYLPVEMLADLRSGIFQEIEDGRPVDLYRRQLQRLFVETLGATLEKKASTSDLPALSRGELKAIKHSLESLLGTDKGSRLDKTTLLHLEDLAARIDRLLDPRGAARKASES